MLKLMDIKKEENSLIIKNYIEYKSKKYLQNKNIINNNLIVVNYKIIFLLN